MASESIFTQPIYPNSFYHVYNRGNYREKIFYLNDNYKYFLKKYNQKLSFYLETYAYCLIPIHFHLLVKTPDNIDKISNQFRKFFISYSQAINKQQSRSGSLFLKPFRRKLITDNNYLKRVIYYIHNNPVHHRICKNIRDYKWSSYNSILSKSNTKLKRKEIIEIFGNLKNFIEFHENGRKLSDEELSMIEY